MKFEKFKAGLWQQRYQYKSFEPVLANHEWTWEDPTINLLEITGQPRWRTYAFDRYLSLFVS